MAALVALVAGCGTPALPTQGAVKASALDAAADADDAVADAPDDAPSLPDVVADAAPDAAPDAAADAQKDVTDVADVPVVLPDIPALLPEPLTVCGSAALPGEPTLTSPLSSVPPCPWIWDLPAADVPDAGATADAEGDAADAAGDAGAAPDAAAEVDAGADVATPPPPPPQKACTCPGQKCGQCPNNSDSMSVYGGGCNDGMCGADGFCQPKPDGTSCAVNYDCAGSCKDGACILFGPDPNVCALQILCNEAGSYGVTPDDGTPCGPDACHPGECVSGGCTADEAPISCEDGDPCTADSCDPKLGCQSMPLTGGSCTVAGQCGQCAKGKCAAAGLSLTPALDFQIPYQLEILDVAAEANGDVIAWGAQEGWSADQTACPLAAGKQYGTARHWIARIGPSGILWQRWASEGLGAYDYVRGRLSNGDLLVAAAQKPGDPVHLLRINAETGDLCMTAFPAFTGSGELQLGPKYLPWEDSEALLALLPDDSVVVYKNLDWNLNKKQTVGYMMHASLNGKVLPGWTQSLGSMFPGYASAPMRVGGSVVFPSLGYFGDQTYFVYDATGKPTSTFGGATYVTTLFAYGTTGLGVAETTNGTLMFWGAYNSTWYEADTSQGRPYAFGHAFSTLPPVAIKPEQPPSGLSAAVLPSGGLALKVGAIMAWTDSAGAIVHLTTLPEPYASMRLFAHFPDGSLGFWSEHRILRLPFSWASCP